MKLNEQETKELTDAIVEMVRNSIVDEQPEASIAVFLYCTNCKDFHLQVYNVHELAVEGLDMLAFLKFLFTKGSDPEGLFISSCKRMGASLANEGKIVLSVTMIGGGGELTVDDDSDVGDIAKKIMDKGEIDDNVDVKALLFIATESQGDIYYQVQYNVEFVSNNDLLFNNREEINKRVSGNLFDIHDALLNSANMITSVKMSMLDEADVVADALLGDNEAKFHSIIDRIRNSFSIDSVG